MEIKKYNIDLRSALCDCLMSLAKSDSRIFWLDSDLMASSGMKKFADNFPKQSVNCGIQEANMLGVAAGLSEEGFIPFVHSFTAFASRRIADQIFISGIYAKQNIRIIASDPGISASPNGGTHMSVEDIGIMRSMPNTIIIDPCDAVQLKSVIAESAKKPGIYYIRLMRKSQAQFYEENQKFEIGKAITAIDGSDAAIITSGTICMTEAVKAAKILSESGISARVIDMFTIKPLDTEIVLKAACELNAIVTVENHNINNGLGSAVAEVIAESGESVKFKRIGIPDCTGEVGTNAYLLEKYQMTANDIANKVKLLLNK